MTEKSDGNQASAQQARAQAEADVRQELGDAALLDLNPADLDSLQQRIGIEEVPGDPDTLNTIAADDTEDNLDLDDDGIADDRDAEIISDLPPEVTQSYGTGLQGQPTDRAGHYSRWSESHLQNDPDYKLTGGDIDANAEQAAVVGDEAVGGTVATPDQDIVDDVAAAVGLELPDRTDVRISSILEERDDRRWELDPSSSEDYSERRD